MIFALFGPSRTGKTTLARHLSPILQVPLRSCGSVVKDRAKVLGIRWQDLSYQEHRKVDADTRQWVMESTPCLVEGRFLDRVLVAVGAKMILVRLDATDSDRERRENLENATGRKVAEQDEKDLVFCGHMYNIAHRLVPSLVLNTSELSVEACAQRIQTLIESSRTPRG